MKIEIISVGLNGDTKSREVDLTKVDSFESLKQEIQEGFRSIVVERNSEKDGN